MQDFSSWWEIMPILQKTFWLIAIPFTIIFIVQTILTFMGLDADHDVDVDMDMDLDTDVGDVDHMDVGEAAVGGLKLFTVRNFITFFTVFSWSGIVFSRMGLNTYIVIGFAMALGLVVMVMIAYMFLIMSQFVQSGSLDTNNAMHQIGEVYIPIPPERSDKGQIQLAVQGRIEEFDAVTDDLTTLPTGSKVMVLEILSQELVLVTAFKEENI